MMKPRKITAVLFSAIFLACAVAMPTQSWAVGGTVLREFENSFVEIAEDVSPSVVHITVRKQLPRRLKDKISEEDFFKMFPDIDPDLKNKIPRDFFFKIIPPGTFPDEVPAGGSGVVFSKEGHILTNNHLVENTDEIKVKIAANNDDRGKEYVAQIIGRDTATDLAVIKIDPEKPLQEARLGDSGALKVGQWAIAIGDPFGLEKTFTVGVISALGRSGFPGPLRRVRYQNFIQTDASINPGNSGGPLLNIDGEVIGINTFIQAAGTGVGFAIPINMAREVYEQLVKHGEVIRGFLGVGIDDLDEGLAAALKIPDLDGALVHEVRPDTPAEKAGIRHGDVIREVGGQKIKDAKMLQNIISHMRPDEKVNVKLLRKGKEKSFNIELMKFPERITVAKSMDIEKNPLGLTVGAIPDRLAQPDEKGVIITKIDGGGAAEEAGLQEGDIILEIDLQEVGSVDVFRHIVSLLEPGRWVSFYIRRADQILYKALKIPPEQDQ